MEKRFLGLPAFSPDWALFLDVDGTLLDISESPDATHVDPDLGRLLRELFKVTGGAMALISGRSVEDIDQLFASSRFCVAGQHGAERRDAGGTLHRQGLAHEKLREAGQQLREMVASHPGLVLEDKGMSLALHFRLAPDLGAQVRDVMRGLAADLGEEFEVQAGKMVFEIKPGGRNKGTAIAEFMRESPFRERVPVFIGDDLTDECGFEFINRMGGHSVKVGEGISSARMRLGDASAVRAWLGNIVEQRRIPGGGSS